jgi:NurA domain
LIIDALKSIIGNETFKPYDSELTGKEVNKKNFTIINQIVNSPIVCIDGGCSTIADGGSWTISKIKIGIVEYDGLKKSNQFIKEFYLIIVSKNKYEIVVYNNGISTRLNLNGVNSVKIEDLPSKIMKYFEWQACLKQSTENLIVMDSGFGAETIFEKELINKALINNLKVVGFCKTSRMRTDSGRSLVGLINSISPRNEKWFYYPIFENESFSKTFVAKLNKINGFAYKIEIPNYLDFINCFETLCFYSKDAEMPGYPYPLYKADKLARINSFELKKDLFIVENELKKTDLYFDSLSKSFHSKMDEKMYK